MLFRYKCPLRRDLKIERFFFDVVSERRVCSQKSKSFPCRSLFLRLVGWLEVKCAQSFSSLVLCTNVKNRFLLNCTPLVVLRSVVSFSEISAVNLTVGSGKY